MKKSIICSLVCSAFVALSYHLTSAAEESSTPVTRHEAELTTVTATVESIDPESREVTLKGPHGDKITLKADKSVKRFGEIKTGDHVRASYYVSLAAELREPTAEEKKNPLMVHEGETKAPETQSPGAAVARRVTAVTTIESIDRSAGTITVKGPRGNTVTSRVENPENLAKMQVGHKIVLTYTEALAISLEKVGNKGAD
jgi:Cu/Ag efflux protein CusF